MFFSETLGPLLTPELGRALSQFLRHKLEGRDTVSPERLRELVSEFLYAYGVRATADSVIDFMARSGRLTFQGASAEGAASFGLAA